MPVASESVSLQERCPQGVPLRDACDSASAKSSSLTLSISVASPAISPLVAGAGPQFGRQPLTSVSGSPCRWVAFGVSITSVRSSWDWPPRCSNSRVPLPSSAGAPDRRPQRARLRQGHPHLPRRPSRPATAQPAATRRPQGRSVAVGVTPAPSNASAVPWCRPSVSPGGSVRCGRRRGGGACHGARSRAATGGR
jgi:hypothetical protein